MKNKIFLLICVFIILNLLIVPSVIANPLPVPTPSATPISVDSIVDFVSEDILYVVDNLQEPLISAKYFFNNPLNVTVEQEILIPFYYSMPDDLEVYINGKEIDEYNYSETEIENRTYDCIQLILTFNINETLEMEIIYTEKDHTIKWGDRFLSSDDFFKDEFKISLIYLAKTGKYWNNFIDANFTIKINKKYFSRGLEGYNISYEENYVVGKKSYTNWLPDEDIRFSWYYKDVTGLICCSAIIVIIVLIIIILILFIRLLIKDKKIKDNRFTKSEIHHCKKCGRPLLDEYVLCPYCGEKK